MRTQIFNFIHLSIFAFNPNANKLVKYGK